MSYHVYKRDDSPITMPLNSRRCTTDSSLLRVRGHCSNKNGAKQLNFSICSTNEFVLVTLLKSIINTTRTRTT